MRTISTELILASTALFTLLSGPLVPRSDSVDFLASPAFADSVTGAVINETVAETLSTTAAPGELRSTLIKAAEKLAQGAAVKVVLAPGIYRDDTYDIDFARGNGQDTLLILEGTSAADIIITGADPVDPQQWKQEGGGLYSMPWTNNWGFVTVPWGPSVALGHRNEMLFAAGDAMPFRQCSLELYAVKKPAYFTKDAMEYKLTNTRAPDTLAEGTFGVMERDGILYARPAAGQTMNGCEIAVRKRSLNFTNKNNIVLRNITWTRFANDHMRNNDGVITFGIRYRPRKNETTWQRNILIDRCRFTWNSGAAFEFTGGGYTVRSSRFDHNGRQGFTGGDSDNVRLEDIDLQMNCWRMFMGRAYGWFTAGTKIAMAENIILRKVRAVGNLSPGIWFDIHCKNVLIEDSIAVDNLTQQLFLELSSGPKLVRRFIGAGGKSTASTGLLLQTLGRARVEDSIWYGNCFSTNRWPIKIVHTYAYDRYDSHYLRDPVVYDTIELTGNVISSGRKSSQMLLGYFDTRTNNFTAATPRLGYTGVSNVFFSDAEREDKAFIWQYPKEYREYQGLSAWSNKYDERFARWIAPGFTDPDARDFTLRPDSLLIDRKKSLPEYRMPAALHEELGRFNKWIMNDPERWTDDLDQ